MKVKRALLKYRGEHCLNCEHLLEITDRYCPRCGQMNSTKKLSSSDFFSEFFQGVFAYDSRLRQTLRVLLFKPGQISKEYIRGRRTMYVNPFRFYLSVSIVFFLIAGLTNSFDSLNFNDKGNLNFENNSDAVGDEIENISPDSIQKINKQLQTIPGLTDKNIQLDSIIKNFPKKKISYKDVYISQENLDTMGFFKKTYKKYDIFTKYNKETQVVNPQTALADLKYRDTKYNHWLYKKGVDLNIIISNPQLFLGYFINKLPFIIFFYLPVFALFIWLLYLRSPYNYMEHLIFAFHVQTVLFVLYTIAIIFDFITTLNWGLPAANLIFVFYLYKSLRKFYGQGRFKTIVKFVILNVIFFILAAIAAMISVIASFAIF